MTAAAKPGYNEMGVSLNEHEIRALAASNAPLTIRLVNDFAFKTTFHNKTALTGLLSALLEIDPAEIRDLEFKDTTLAREYAEDKEGILDIKLVMNGNRKLNIEIQVLPTHIGKREACFTYRSILWRDSKKGTAINR